MRIRDVYKDLNHSILWTEYRRWNVNSKLRFGQYMVNKYLQDGHSDPEVFYEKNNGVAYAALVKRINEYV